MNSHQLKIEVHDMSNLLMRADAYINRGDFKLVRSTMDVIMDCFGKIKKIVYDQTTGEGMVSMGMGERFNKLLDIVPKYEEIYGVKIFIECQGCNTDDRIFTPSNAPDTVFSNAIQNASKAGATEVRVFYQSTPYYILITYKDNGKGMSKEKLENLGFAPSTGQGISLIRNMVHASGGTCWWESTLGEGTIMTVKLRKDLGSCSRP
jgi:signal transduction histidine kinase